MFKKEYLIVETSEDREAHVQISECDLPSEVRRILKYSKGKVKVFQNVTERFVKEKNTCSKRNSSKKKERE